VKELMPDRQALTNWLDMARARIKFQDAARICWVASAIATGSAWRSTTWSRAANWKRRRHRRDHLDSGSVASPNRETEAMRDGSDAVSDWPFAQCAATRQRRHVGLAASWRGASASAIRSTPACDCRRRDERAARASSACFGRSSVGSCVMPTRL